MMPLSSIKPAADSNDMCGCGHRRYVHKNGVCRSSDGCKCTSFTPAPPPPDYSKNPFNVLFLNKHDPQHLTAAPTVCFAEAAWDAAIDSAITAVASCTDTNDGRRAIESLRSMKQRDGGK